MRKSRESLANALDWLGRLKGVWEFVPTDIRPFLIGGVASAMTQLGGFIANAEWYKVWWLPYVIIVVVGVLYAIIDRLRFRNRSHTQVHVTEEDIRALLIPKLRQLGEILKQEQGPNPSQAFLQNYAETVGHLRSLDIPHLVFNDFEKISQDEWSLFIGGMLSDLERGDIKEARSIFRRITAGRLLYPGHIPLKLSDKAKTFIYGNTPPKKVKNRNSE